jgi:hypothetical protein
VIKIKIQHARCSMKRVDTGRVEIQRPSSGPSQQSLLRDLIVYIDDNEAGRISDGQSGKYTLTSGTHTLKVRLAANFYESPVTRIDVPVSGSVMVVCTANYYDESISAAMHPHRFFSLDVRPPQSS